MLRVPASLLELNLERRGEWIDGQITIGIAELDQLGPRAGQRFVFAHEGDTLHLRKCRDVLGGLGDGLRRSAAQEIRHDFDPLLHSAQGFAQIERHQAEQADDVKRKGDGGDGQDRERRGPAEDVEGFAQDEPHGSSSLVPSSVPLSKTIAPSRISTVR